MITNDQAKKLDNSTQIISKLGQRRQVVIPKKICDELNISTGDFLEVCRVEGAVVIQPKMLVDADDVLTPDEEKIISKGEEEIKQGKARPWKQIKNDLGL
jgi:AbrB family looped-hinge helix DNA binding protein